MSPCSQQKVVNCWVVRKTEKEIFLRYMILMQFVSIGISVADIIVMLKKLRRNRSRSHVTTKKSARKRVDKDTKSALPKPEQQISINCCYCRRKKATSANREQIENKTFKLSNSSSENDNVFSNDSSSSSK